MRRKQNVKARVPIVFATAAFALSGAVDAAVAQTGSGAEPSQVTIQAGHHVERTQVGTSYTGIPLELTQLTGHVGFGDLDLATPKGQHELQRRIDRTATAACKQLDQLFPLDAADLGTTYEDPDCIHAARQSAEAQVKAAIASADHRSSMRQASK